MVSFGATAGAATTAKAIEVDADEVEGGGGFRCRVESVSALFDANVLGTFFEGSSSSELEASKFGQTQSKICFRSSGIR